MLTKTEVLKTQRETCQMNYCVQQKQTDLNKLRPGSYHMKLSSLLLNILIVLPSPSQQLLYCFFCIVQLCFTANVTQVGINSIEFLRKKICTRIICFVFNWMKITRLGLNYGNQPAKVYHGMRQGLLIDHHALNSNGHHSFQKLQDYQLHPLPRNHIH